MGYICLDFARLLYVVIQFLLTLNMTVTEPNISQAIANAVTHFYSGVYWLG